MRKSSSPSLSNCNSVLANKIFGIPLDELQQEGQPDNEVPFIVRHVVDYIEEHGMYHLAVFKIMYFTVILTGWVVGFEEYLFSEVNYSTGCDLVVLSYFLFCSFCYVYHCFLANSNVVSSAGHLIGNAAVEVLLTFPVLFYCYWAQESVCWEENCAKLLSRKCFSQCGNCA